MKRDPEKASLLPDPVRIVAGLTLGADACYFVGAAGEYGEMDDPSIIDFNLPPAGQPGLWCHWNPSEDGTAIEWDGGEKFYDYLEWLAYLIEHFLAPWGYQLTGDVRWQGDECDDVGVLEVRANVVARASVERTRR